MSITQLRAKIRKINVLRVCLRLQSENIIHIFYDFFTLHMQEAKLCFSIRESYKKFSFFIYEIQM